METEIQKFYKHKTVFVTGGTGFVGKVFIEKLLRVTEVERIYVLVRSKRGKDIDQRMENIFRDPLFDELRKLHADPAKRVTAISGDCTLPHLGLSEKDRNTLIEHVELVVHSAATVRFNEPLNIAVAINVRATMDMIQLAKKMLKLKAFLHVSSAFANCPEKHIDERYYPQIVGMSAAEVCNMAETLGSEGLNSKTDELLKDFPNTYCYTKSLAEEAVLTQASELPICIFRPGIVVPTCHEPIKGWIDNLYGPISILFATASGVLHVVYLKQEINAALVPVDYCANMMLTCIWNMGKSAKQSETNPAPIYNFVPVECNMLKWSNYISAMKDYGYNMPITRMLWLPFLITTDSKFYFRILSLLFHTIPGYIFDLLFLVAGKRRRMVQTYRKIHYQLDLLSYFTERNWTFGMNNTTQLWESLSEADQKLFRFDTGSLNWPEYIYNSLWGMRRFLAKEEPSTVPKAQRMLSRLLMLHRTMQLLIFGGGMLLVCCTLLRMWQLL